MPEASDGKKFPYTKKGMADYEKYQASLDRKNKNMGDVKVVKNMGNVKREALPPFGYATLGDANEDVMPPNVWKKKGY
mgnify:CR=1 FL=1